MLEALADGSLRRLAMALIVVALCAVAERGWVRLRWIPYFAVGFPLLRDPIPLERVPDAPDGTVAGLRWTRLPKGDGAAWWADPDQRGFPRGLHGIVWWGVSQRTVALSVRWCPPWTPLLAMAWLGLVGAADGQGWLTGPLACVLAIGIFTGYQRPAVRAAASLRYAWARDGGES